MQLLIQYYCVFFQLWITGGSNSGNLPGIENENFFSPAKTSELVDDNGSTPGKELPRKFLYHCACKMNDTHGILTGGEFVYFC